MTDAYRSRGATSRGGGGGDGTSRHARPVKSSTANSASSRLCLSSFKALVAPLRSAILDLLRGCSPGHPSPDPPSPSLSALRSAYSSVGRSPVRFTWPADRLRGVAPRSSVRQTKRASLTENPPSGNSLVGNGAAPARRSEASSAAPPSPCALSIDGAQWEMSMTNGTRAV